MRILALAGFTVLDDAGAPLPVTSTQQRILEALLLAGGAPRSAEEVRRVAQLAEVATVAQELSKLRRAWSANASLGMPLAEVLPTARGLKGYRLGIPVDSVDVWCLERTLRRLRGADLTYPNALALLREVEGIWAASEDVAGGASGHLLGERDFSRYLAKLRRLRAENDVRLAEAETQALTCAPVVAEPGSGAFSRSAEVRSDHLSGLVVEARPIVLVAVAPPGDERRMRRLVEAFGGEVVRPGPAKALIGIRSGVDGDRDATRGVALARALVDEKGSAGRAVVDRQRVGLRSDGSPAWRVELFESAVALLDGCAADAVVVTQRAAGSVRSGVLDGVAADGVVGEAGLLLEAGRSDFVGRGEEVALVESRLRRGALTGEGGVVTLVGEPGVGKSRLIEEVLRRGNLGGVRVVRAACLPWSGGGSGAILAELIRCCLGVTGRASATEVRAALDELVAPVLGDALGWMVDACAHHVVGSEHDSSFGAEEVVSALARVLGTAAGLTPTLVVLEDAHWADDMVLDALSELVRDASEGGALLLVSARPELLDRGNSWPSAGSGRLTLVIGELSSAEIGLIVDGRCAVGGVDREDIIQRASGNPLFAECLADAYREDSLGSIPSSIEDVMLARLSGIDAAERAVLHAMAVLGEGGGVSVVSRVAGLDEAATRRASAGLRARSLVRWRANDATHVLAHALVAEVVYASIPPERVVGLHQRAIDALDGADGRALLERARHWTAVLASSHRVLDTCDYARAYQDLMGAATTIRHFIPAAAAPYYELSATIAANDTERIRSYLSHAEAIFDADVELPIGLASLEKALSLLRDDTPRELWHRSMLAQSTLSLRAGRARDAVAILEDILSVCTDSDVSFRVATSIATFKFAMWFDSKSVDTLTSLVAGDPDCRHGAASWAARFRLLMLLHDSGDLSVDAAAFASLGSEAQRHRYRRVVEMCAHQGSLAAVCDSGPKVGLKQLANKDSRSNLDVPRCDFSWRQASLLELAFETGDWDRAKNWPLATLGTDAPIAVAFARVSTLIAVARRERVSFCQESASDHVSIDVYDVRVPALENLAACAHESVIEANFETAITEASRLAIMTGGVDAPVVQFSRTGIVRLCIEAGLVSLAAEIAVSGRSKRALGSTLSQAQMGYVAEARGDFDDAVAILTAAARKLHGLDMVVEAAHARAALGRSLLAVGRPDAAVTELSAARRVYESLRAKAWLARLPEIGD